MPDGWKFGCDHLQRLKRFDGGLMGDRLIGPADAELLYLRLGADPRFQ